MKDEKIYGVFDSSYLVFKGTRYEICSEYRIAPKGFYEYLRSTRRLKGKYRVGYINGDEPIQKKPEPIFKSVEEERLEYLFSHLKMYGNTHSEFDPKPFMKTLKKKGITAEFRDSPFGGYYIEVTS